MSAFASRSDWPKGESPPLRCLCTLTTSPRIPPTLSSHLHPFRATPRVSIFLSLSLLSSSSVLCSSSISFPFRFLFPPTNAARAARCTDNTNAHERHHTRTLARVSHTNSLGRRPVYIHTFIITSTLRHRCYSPSFSSVAPKLIGAYCTHALALYI